MTREGHRLWKRKSGLFLAADLDDPNRVESASEIRFFAPGISLHFIRTAAQSRGETLADLPDRQFRRPQARARSMASMAKPDKPPPLHKLPPSEVVPNAGSNASCIRMFILDRSKNDTSVTLDLLRAVAAQMVCVGHGIAFFMPPWRPSELPLMQNVGVLIFFVLSGLLISFTLIERSKQPSYGFGTFLLERFARIYSGLVPALLFVVVLDGVVIYIFNEKAFADYYTAKTFVANLFMFESYRGVLSKYLRRPAFGSASPLWTLAIEWHIYMFVAAVFFIWARPRQRLLMIALAILFCQVPLHYLRGAQSGGRRRHGTVLPLARGHLRSSRAPDSTVTLLGVAVPRALCGSLFLSRHQGGSGIQFSHLCDPGGVFCSRCWQPRSPDG